MRILTSAFLISFLAIAAGADPVAYQLQPERSTVGFSYVLAGQKLNGRMPIDRAELMLDFDRPSNSIVSATLRPDKADAGPGYATAAMKSGDVLATDDFPTIFFVATRITETAAGATLEGEITIRDVTRPVTLEAQFFRQRGTEPGDMSSLSIVMQGSVSRSDFGAAGFGGLVGDQVELTILARIERLG